MEILSTINLNWAQCMNNLEYLDHLSTIPAELVDDILTTVEIGERYSSKGNTEASSYKHFASINASDKLKEFTNSLFNFKHDAHIFVLSDHIPPHIDNLEVRDVAFNYVIKSGAGVTRFHTDKTDDSIYEEHTIDVGRWHRLNVANFHSVTIPNPPRIVLTMSTLKGRL